MADCRAITQSEKSLELWRGSGIAPRRGEAAVMITYEYLGRRPSAFRSLTGYSSDQFDALFVEFAPAHEQRRQTAPTTRREGKPRACAVGAGGQPPIPSHPATRLLTTELNGKKWEGSRISSEQSVARSITRPPCATWWTPSARSRLPW